MRIFWLALRREMERAASAVPHCNTCIHMAAQCNGYVTTTILDAH